MSDDTGPEGYPSLAGTTRSTRRYPAKGLFNKEKRQEKKARREAVKAELGEQIKPRPTYAQRQETNERKEQRDAKAEARENKVADRLRELHAGTAPGDVVNLGADLLYLTGLSNVQLQIHDQMSKRDKCFSRWTAYGRHDKDLLGMAPTNREIRFGGMSVCFFGETGDITQEAHYWDMVALLQQIQAP